MHRHTRSILLLLTALAAFTPGCARMWAGAGKLGPGVPGAGGWARLTVPGTGASFTMPGQPEFQTSRHVHEDGTPYVQSQAVSRTPSGYFAFTVLDVEGGLVGDPLRELDAVTAQAAEDLHFAEQRISRLDVPGFYGRQVAGRTNDGVVVVMRSYLGFSRVYTAVVGAPDTPASQPMVEAFFEGVQLDPGDTLYPQAAPTAGSSSATAVWAPVFMPEDDFGVEIPVLSEIRVEQVEIAERSAAVRTYEATLGATRYRVRVASLDGSHPELEEVGAALSLGEVTGPSQASGYPGAAFRQRSAEGAADGRVIVTASRLYVLEVQHPADEDVSADRFFDSLRIL